MIDINLNAGFELASLNSTYHKVQIEQSSQTTRSIYLGDSYQADRDFELTWSAIKTLEPEIALFTQVKDDK